MPEMLYTCEACGTAFRLSHRFQVFRDGDRTRYFCCEPCRKKTVQGLPTAVCEHCGREFAREFAYQELAHAGVLHRVCSVACRREVETALAPAPARVARVCVANQKGGTGKTTTASHLACGAAARGLPTLLIDADPQGSLTELLQAEGEPGLADVLDGRAELLATARHAGDRLHFLPAGRGLQQAAWSTGLDASKVRAALASLDAFRLVVIDPSPAMCPLTEAMLVFAGSVLVPVSCDYLALHGVRQLAGTLADLRDRLGRPVTLLGVVPTFFDGRTRASRAVVDILDRHFPGKVLPAVRASADIRETAVTRRAVFESSPSGRGAADYTALVDAVLARIEGPG